MYVYTYSWCNMTWMVYMGERTYMYTAEFVIYDDAYHLKK